MSLTAGHSLSHYRLVAPLGAGGMGEVWLAEDATLKRKVALKVLPVSVAADPDRLARFQREAEAVAALNHPNIVTIHSIEEDGDVRFLTMELVEGQSLDKAITRGGLPLAQVLDIGIALVDALAASHEKGIVHRDIKPANIMLAGRERRVKVLDFGLAKLREEETFDGETRTAAITGEGKILGTAQHGAHDRHSPRHLVPQRRPGRPARNFQTPCSVVMAGRSIPSGTRGKILVVVGVRSCSSPHVFRPVKRGIRWASSDRSYTHAEPDGTGPGEVCRSGSCSRHEDQERRSDAMPRGRAGVVLCAALLIVAGAAAIGWLALHRHRGPETQAVAGGTVSSRSSAGSTGDARDGTTGSAAGATLPPDDWMQPYRGMTLDQAFDEVTRRVRFEPYAGIQRGARGTARAKAGNAIDQALLLAAILRAAGHEVRLVHGSLSPQNTAAILRGLYPPRVESAAFDAAYLPYEATADSGLGALVRDHYWVEVNQGSTWLPLDPSFPRAKIGEAYGTAADRFAEPPADLYQRIEFAWKIDTRDRGGQQVARWSGTVADVGLLPISLVVDAIPASRKEAAPPQPSAGGMFGGALAGGAPPKPAGEQPAADRPPAAIRYARSVETDARQPATGNVALLDRPGSFVRREYLEIKLSGPGGLDRTIERTLYEVDGETGSPQAEHRRYTLLVVPGPVSESYRDAEIARWRAAIKLDEWRNEAAGLQQQAGSDAAATAAVGKAAGVDAVAGKAAGYLMTLEFAAHSDALTDRIAYPNHVAVVRALPRVLIASSETLAADSSRVASSVALDLRLDEVQAYPYPGFPSRAVPLFLAARGMQESVLEGTLVARWTGRETVSTAALMTEATRKRVRLLAVTPDSREALAAAQGLSPRVQAEIEAAVNAGHHVIVPADAVALAGRPRWGWWDVDPASGAIVGVMEGGQHQAVAEYSMSSQGIGINDKNAYFLGCIVGANSTMFFVCGKLLETGTVTPELIAAVEAYLENAACNTMCPAEAGAGASVSASVGGCYTIDKFKEGMKPAIGASAALDFCAKYNDGFKCAGGLILAGLKGEMPGVTVSAEAKITLPCGVGK